YAPIGATITTAKIADALEGEAGFYSTYGWHPAATDVAIRNIRWIVKHRTRLLRGVNALSDHFGERLASMRFRDPARLRIKGLAIGVESGDEKYLDKVTERCRQKGLLVTSAGNILTLFPPLTIDRETADEGLDILESSLR
ncbi:MAG TPA: aminotransferase class III-fold pyridoxal phosphate-dependent enzyme, partial [Thermoanaerobaculia bacterium]|nr:aminotransferase class III-fold pyridoxal phosphate-dependent enzyme [Thermoanaerobaculia bacterium]